MMIARHMMAAIAAILLVALSAQRCLPQEPGVAPHPIGQAMTKAGEGKLLAAVALLEASGNKAEYRDVLATFRSFLGDWRGAHQAADESYPKPPKGAVAFPQPVTHSSALEAIAEQAQHHRVLIVNESHHVPQHRAFILEMLRKLRGQGFQYYAVETLAEDVQDIQRRGYPVRNTGFYSVEPVFGDLIREALAMGFQLVAYEAALDEATEGAATDPIESINAREAAQCKNLMERLFAKDREAKVIIHVGFDHALERPRKLKDGREILWMAARLARELGVDPLTIDQTLHTERGTLHNATPQWRQALDNGWLKQPLVLRQQNGSFLVTGHFAGLLDMQVFHPPTTLVEGRPNWLAGAIGKKPVAIPGEIRDGSGRVLVQAFLENESEDAIPVDQAILMPGKPRPKLFLRPGRYRLLAQDEQGNEVFKGPLVVAESDNAKSG